MTESLTISGQIDAQMLTVFETVSQAAHDLGIPYVVVGATARDLVLHHVYGAKIQRATTDVDFGFQVSDWGHFDAMKRRLGELGCKETKVQHRMIGPQGITVDIVPFGPVANSDANIAWPPKGDVAMSVLGFQEAHESADWVCVRNEPRLDVPVATPVGMVLLKLVAWTDRDARLRRKDALDIAYLLGTYDSIPEVMDTLYDHHAETLESLDWDLQRAASYLLGQRARGIASEATSERILRLIGGQLDRLDIERLKEEMCEHLELEFEKNQNLLETFIAGFRREADNR